MADSQQRQAAFSSWNSAVAAQELCLFFGELYGGDRIVTDTTALSSTTSAAAAAAAAPSQALQADMKA